MPRRTVPKYRLHRPSGLAVVTLGGRDIYLGPHESKASRVEYDRLIAEWLLNGRQYVPPTEQESALTVSALMLAYIEHVEEYYVRDGKPSHEQGDVKRALRLVRELYGPTPAAAFGPVALRACRERLIERGLNRKSVNVYTWRIKRMFRWGVANELVPASVFHGLEAVEGLRRGHTRAPEGKKVLPVPEEDVKGILDQVSAPVAAMIRLQWLTGMRPGEVVILREADIDRTGEEWEYRPARHKTEHHGHDRVVPLGPQCREILQPFLEGAEGGYLFRPAHAERARHVKQRLARRTPMTPSQRARKPRSKREKSLQPHYGVASYRRAITRACDKAGVPHWTPHRLRHSAATRFRREFGIETTRMILGHRSSVITEIYAEPDWQKATEAMRRVG
jgi:integrase